MGARDVDFSVLQRILEGSEEPRDLPMDILTSITDNFSQDRKVGRGGFGDVYKGVLDDWTVAVKKIRVNSYNIERENLFYREVDCLLKIIEHRNVVRFLGFCSHTHLEAKESTRAEKRHVVEIRERLLCFEYISNGSLDKYITDELRGLEWNNRYQIIKGICDGLQYLHNEMGIIHMDLKPANIMVVVDIDDLVPKITDFGLARLVENNSTTDVPFFSRGYCAPEYITTGKPKFECDIYSLGTIIREIITGRNEEVAIKDVIRRWRCRWRKSATNTPLHVQQITKCVQIAERCTKEDPKRRPSISHIIRDLNESANTNKKIPSGDDDMLAIEPLELTFDFELLNKEISKETVLTNVTGNCIAFNIKTPSQLQYCTQPNKGIVLPGSKYIVNITLQAQGTTTGHEFIVQSTKVVYGLTDKEITEMFNKEAGRVVDEVNLTIVYDARPEKTQADQSPNASVSKGQHTCCSRSKDVRLNFRPIETTSATIQYKASERAAVDILTGAMGGLLPKLDQLLNEAYNMPKYVKENLESVKKQLKNKHIVLCKVPHDEMHILDPLDKEWANEVKELSYVIDDMVDKFLISKGRDRGRGTRARVRTMWGRPRALGFPCLVQKMLRQVRKVADKSELKLTTSVANNRAARSTDVDPRILDLYKKHKYVGIDGPRDSLVKKLTGIDDLSKKKLKIISIFGEGGLGKTTLAKQVYDKLADKFVLKAFVPVGRNPDINRVLEDILFELDKNGNRDIHNLKKNERQLIDLLQELLHNKRYFIVIDDIWDTKSWKIIECALIDNGNGSRVMTTSRINDVTKSSGEGCKLEPLSYDQSKQLFYSRLTCKSTNTSDQPNKQSTKYILEKCGGLPLAIITIASLLDGKREEDWPKVYSSIKFRHDDSNAENIKKILLFSYFDLPYHLKTCLLYLSIYPEDSLIEKRKLVWKWIAEGFVQQNEGKTLFEVGEGYFNELINRSLIQPVELTVGWWHIDRIQAGTIGACRIHDMVLDIICSRAKEENFATILDTDEKHLSSQNNARILAIHKSVLVNTCIQQQIMRSFNASGGCDLSRMGLDLLHPSFPVLRVLSLENCEGVSGDNAYRLKNIAQLRHLRFLSLAGTSVIQLPMEIGDLRCLQILDLMQTGIEELPQSVTQLRELKSLFCSRSHSQKYVKLPAGMGSLTSLEELCLSLNGWQEGNNLTELADSLKELGNLTELRVLQIYTLQFFGILNKALVESLNKLKKIEKLEIRRSEYHKDISDSRWEDYAPCKVLRHLHLCCFKLPGWMDASLENIFHLEVSLTLLTARDLFHLGSLPKLQYLVLGLGFAKDLHGIVVASGAFPKLRHLDTQCWLTFVPEAMQCLESLKLEISLRGHVEFDFNSLQCLHALEKVSAEFFLDMMMNPAMEEKSEATIKAALRRAVDNHPNGPILDQEYIRSGTDSEYSSSCSGRSGTDSEYSSSCSRRSGTDSEYSSSCSRRSGTDSEYSSSCSE